MEKCFICGDRKNSIESIYSHMEKEHDDLIPKNYSTSQYHYFLKTGRTEGMCIICKTPTKWNESIKKYHRFCENPKCKQKYREEFKRRMIGAYGKIHMLNDPEHQKKMLANRSISGEYVWSDGKKISYTGSYELDFLKMLDVLLRFDSVDIMSPSPHTYYYEYEGKKHFYIPDMFIPSLNLEIEIKEGGSNPNTHSKIIKVDKVKEKLKDKVLMSQNVFNYVKITDKNYEPFFKFLKDMKDIFVETGKDPKTPLFILGESFTDIEEYDITIESKIPMDDSSYTLLKKYPAQVPISSQNYDRGIMIDIAYRREGKSGEFFNDHKYSKLASVIPYAHGDGNVDIVKVHDNPPEYEFIACKKICIGDELKVNWSGYVEYFGKEYDYFKESLDVVLQNKALYGLMESTYNLQKVGLDDVSVFASTPMHKHTNIGTLYYRAGQSDEYVLTSLGKNIKHSETPNTDIENFGKEYYIMSSRDISKGEEITVDHSNFPANTSEIDEGGVENVATITESTKEITNFPRKGDNEKISFKNSKFPEFDHKYALDLEKNYPEIMEKGGNIRGNDAFKYWKMARKGNYTKEVYDWMREREAWAARHVVDTRLPGIIANVKWGTIVNKGEKYMKDIIEEAKEKYDKKEVSKEATYGKDNMDYFKGRAYEIKKSNVSGKGAFSLRFVYHGDGYGIAFKKISNTGNPDKDFIRSSLGEYTNHSDNPNLRVAKTKGDDHIRYDFIAIRDIKKGEELFINYNDLDWEGESDFTIESYQYNSTIVYKKRHGTERRNVNNPNIFDSKDLESILDSFDNIWISGDYHILRIHDGELIENENSELIIQNQNELVENNDAFIYLGDLVDSETDRQDIVRNIIESLSGKLKIMILGNHDLYSVEFYKECGFDYVIEGLSYKDIIFTHKPIETDSINVHGHLHEMNEYHKVAYNRHVKVYLGDTDYKPVNLKELK